MPLTRPLVRILAAIAILAVAAFAVLWIGARTDLPGLPTPTPPDQTEGGTDAVPDDER